MSINSSEIKVSSSHSTAILGDITYIVATRNQGVKLIDREAALTHLAALGYKPGNKVCLRFIGKDGAKNLDGIYPNLFWDAMNNHQAEGRNAYFIVNPGGHADADISQCRAIFYEHDGNLDKPTSKELWRKLGLPEPTIQVDTGGKSIHSYWLLDEPITPEEWRDIQTDLLEFADGDKSLKNPSRVMRLAGGIYIKPSVTPELVHSSIVAKSNQKYPYEQLREIIPSRHKQSTPALDIHPRQLTPATTQKGAYRNRQEFFKKTQVPVDDVIPLSECIAPKHRKLIDEGVGEGNRDNMAYQIAADLAATERYLLSIGQAYDESTNMLLRLFGKNCQPPLDAKDIDRIFNSADKRAKQPTLDVDFINNNILNWMWRQVRPEEETSTPASVAVEKGEKKKEDEPTKLKIALEIAEQYKYELAFDDGRHSWQRYGISRQGVWELQSKEAIEAWVQQLILSKMGTEYDFSSYDVTNIATLLRNAAHVTNWNEVPSNVMLPFRNGVLNLESKELMSHNSRYRFTWRLERDYDDTAKNWDGIRAFLMHLADGNLKIFTTLLCFCNAVVKGRHDLQMFLHLIGAAGAGKGSFIRLLTLLVGKDNTTSTNLNSWCEGKNETARAEFSRLLIFSDETSIPKNISNFLKATGEDLLSSEKKYKDAYDYLYRGMVILGSNDPINWGTKGREGIDRRQIVIRVNKAVPVSERRDLTPMFESEIAAFTNAVLDLSDQYVTDTLKAATVSAASKSNAWQMRIETDTLALWANESIIRDPESVLYMTSTGSTAATRGAYADYTEYCEKNGINHPLTNRTFTTRLADLCQSVLGWDDVIKDRRKKGTVIVGIKLRREGVDDDNPTLEQIFDSASQADI